jgi:hypothetical protein
MPKYRLLGVTYSRGLIPTLPAEKSSALTLIQHLDVHISTIVLFALFIGQCQCAEDLCKLT